MKNNVLDHLTNIHSINIPDLLSGERKSKVMENTFAIGHLLWETLYIRRCMTRTFKSKKQKQNRSANVDLMLGHQLSLRMKNNVTDHLTNINS